MPFREVLLLLARRSMCSADARCGQESGMSEQKPQDRRQLHAALDYWLERRIDLEAQLAYAKTIAAKITANLDALYEKE